MNTITPTVNDLIVNNRPLAVFLANRYSNPRTRDDMIAEAFLALTVAAQTFDTSNGTPFKNYAAHVITNNLLSMMRGTTRHRNKINDLATRTTSSMLEVEVEIDDTKPINLWELLDRANLTERERTVIVHRYGLEGHAAKTIEQVSEIVGCSRQRVHQMIHELLRRLHTLATANTK